MDYTLAAAVINARVAIAHIRLEGMRTANLVRITRGLKPAYDEQAMTALIREIGLDDESIKQTISDCIPTITRED